MNRAEKTKKIIFHYWEYIKTLTDPKGFDFILWDLSHISDKEAVTKIKQMTWQRAQAVGLDYNKKTKKFIKK